MEKEDEAEDKAEFLDFEGDRRSRTWATRPDLASIRAHFSRGLPKGAEADDKSSDEIKNG